MGECVNPLAMETNNLHDNKGRHKPKYIKIDG